jgi:hypothetical protein
MIVIRYTWCYQKTSFQKARKMFTEVKVPQTNLLRGTRAYESVTGTGYMLALEWEFESLSDWEKFSAQFFGLPENVELLRNYPEANVQTTEVWRELSQS